MQVVSKHGNELTEAALQDMPYLAATIKEGGKVHPIVGAIPRLTLADLDIDGYLVPKVGEVNGSYHGLFMLIRALTLDKV